MKENSKMYQFEIDNDIHHVIPATKTLTGDCGVWG